MDTSLDYEWSVWKLRRKVSRIFAKRSARDKNASRIFHPSPVRYFNAPCTSFVFLAKFSRVEMLLLKEGFIAFAEFSILCVCLWCFEWVMLSKFDVSGYQYFTRIIFSNKSDSRFALFEHGWRVFFESLLIIFEQLKNQSAETIYIVDPEINLLPNELGNTSLD